MKKTCTNCGETKMAYTFVRYYGTVMNELSVCTACRKIVPPPKRGWGSQRPKVEPIGPAPVKTLLKAAKIRKAQRVKHSSNISKVLRALHDSCIRHHPYGLTLRKILIDIRDRIRGDTYKLYPKLTWRDLLTTEERNALFDAAADFKKGVSIRANIDQFLLTGD